VNGYAAASAVGLLRWSGLVMRAVPLFIVPPALPLCSAWLFRSSRVWVASLNAMPAPLRRETTPRQNRRAGATVHMHNDGAGSPSSAGAVMRPPK